MLRLLFSLLFCSLFFLNTTLAQDFRFEKDAIIKRIKTDVYTLADDSMMGRETATLGEQKAARYIEAKMKEAGLAPAFRNNTSYLQPFTYDSSPTLKGENYCIVNKLKFATDIDYIPLAFSGSGKIQGEIVKVGYGITAKDFGYDDYEKNPNIKGKIVLIDIGFPEKYRKNEEFTKLFSSVKNRVDNAVSKGAAAVILINPDQNLTEPPSYNLRWFSYSTVPVVIAKQRLFKTLMDGTAWKAELAVNIDREPVLAYNVGGYLDNGAPYTVIIGAHYDHLGCELEDDGINCKKNSVYNGADDNASGVAGVLELARQLKNSNLKNNNYLFLAFSGEEKGFLGSAYFIKSEEYDIDKINYMLNLDMIGRLSSNNNTLSIYGTGTSGVWMKIFPKIKVDNIKINAFESGLGSSDHTTFYLKKIPALHFFTELHSDYHKQSDDADRVNYPGIASVVKFIIETIREVENLAFVRENPIKKLPFYKTNDNTISRKNLKITLGIVPDHSYNGKGIKVSAVKDNQIAANSGIKEGDIIIKIGKNEITDFKSYMTVLSELEAGTETEAIVLRDDKEVNIKLKL